MRGGERLVEGDFGRGAGFDDEGAGGVAEDAITGDFVSKMCVERCISVLRRFHTYWPAAAFPKAMRVEGSRGDLDMVVVDGWRRYHWKQEKDGGIVSWGEMEKAGKWE